jgi:hypothetical protein
MVKVRFQKIKDKVRNLKMQKALLGTLKCNNSNIV